MTEIRSLSLHFELWRQMCGKPAIILYISSVEAMQGNMCICVWNARWYTLYRYHTHTHSEVLMVSLCCLYINNFPLSLLFIHSHLLLAPAHTSHCISSLCTHILNCVSVFDWLTLEVFSSSKNWRKMTCAFRMHSHTLTNLMRLVCVYVCHTCICRHTSLSLLWLLLRFGERFSHCFHFSIGFWTSMLSVFHPHSPSSLYIQIHTHALTHWIKHMLCSLSPPHIRFTTHEWNCHYRTKERRKRKTNEPTGRQVWEK